MYFSKKTISFSTPVSNSTPNFYLHQTRLVRAGSTPGLEEVLERSRFRVLHQPLDRCPGRILLRSNELLCLGQCLRLFLLRRTLANPHVQTAASVQDERVLLLQELLLQRSFGDRFHCQLTLGVRHTVQLNAGSIRLLERSIGRCGGLIRHQGRRTGAQNREEVLLIGQRGKLIHNVHLRPAGMILIAQIVRKVDRLQLLDATRMRTDVHVDFTTRVQYEAVALVHGRHGQLDLADANILRTLDVEQPLRTGIVGGYVLEAAGNATLQIADSTLEVAEEKVRLGALHFPVLYRQTAQQIIELHGQDRGRTGLILGSFRAEPEVDVVRFDLLFVLLRLNWGGKRTK